jgi:hypothetical protein
LKNLRNVLMAALASLALLFGLAGATAPAQAAVSARADVYLSSAPSGGYLRTTVTSGTTYNHRVGQTIITVFRSCAARPLIDQIRYKRQGSSTWRTLPLGQCVSGAPGLTTVRLV